MDTVTAGRSRTGAHAAAGIGAAAPASGSASVVAARVA